ncbi:hypothetical protein AB0J74_14690 [Asanoa sp. NPDC049573]|uniref:hypothetical protein n=1 Tax=Asanoa sp. NPDC049573 TaxID=3155396 RepID=UPI003421BB39
MGSSVATVNPPPGRGPASNRLPADRARSRIPIVPKPFDEPLDDVAAASAVGPASLVTVMVSRMSS